MSGQVKICEACGSENDPFVVICFCGQPISHILPTSKVTAHEPHEIPVPTQKPGEKVCSGCGASHPSHRLSCDCGERLPAEAPTTSCNPLNSPSEAGATTVEPTLRKLELVIGGQRILLKDGDILGRTGTVEVSSFSRIPEISREHASIVFLNAQWHVIPLSPNMTELDGVVLSRGKPHPLTGHHRMRLSTKCQITLEVA
jgi:hypothetical protein